MDARLVLAASLFIPLSMAPGATFAATGEVEESVVEIAVLDVRVTGDIDSKRVEGISGLLAAEASRHPRIDVRSSSDIRAILGFEAEKQLLGCEDDGACMAEMAGALGVDYILTSELTRLGETFVLTLTLLDPASGRARTRAGERVQREADLIDAADRALREVLATLGPAQPGRSPGRRSPDGAKWFAWGFGGVGVGAGVGGGLLLLSAWQTYWASEGADGRSVTMEDIDSARRIRAPVGVGLMAGGAALVAAAFLVPKRPAPSGARASFAVLDDGAVAVLTVSIP